MYQKTLLLLILSILVVLPAQAKMYKWVDDDGNVHYGDKVPTKYLHKERRELSEQGTLIKKVDRAATEEEKEQKRLEEQARAEKAEQERVERAKDRVLLDTYTTERDLVAAKDARVEAVGSQIQLSETIIADAQRKLDETAKRVAQVKASGREVPQHMYDKMAREEKQLATHKKVAAGHKKNREAIIVQFDAYIERFRKLMENKRAKREARLNKQQSN